MTCNEWESGSIVIPTAQWAKFKRKLRDVFNEENDRVYGVALKLYEDLLALGKGKRKFDWATGLRALLDATERCTGYSYGTYQRPKYALSDDQSYRVADAILPRSVPAAPGEPEKPRKPQKPQKKDFPRATEKTLTFCAGYEGHITFDDAKHAVRWCVNENNHAIENARESRMGRALFAALDRVEWVRGSGGVIVGNDEYNREDREPGGGGNRIQGVFGPLGKQEQEAQRTSLVARVRPIRRALR